VILKKEKCILNNITLPKFDTCRHIIKKQRLNEKTWDEIYFAGMGNTNALKQFIDINILAEQFPEELTIDLWMEIVTAEKRAEEKTLSLKQEQDTTSLISTNSDNDISIPQGDKSSWQLYKNKLLDSGWSKESVIDIEEATIKVLRKLNSDTTKIGPVKGLMVGHVQSGKTANMAALMAMAADWGWNMFIVLSGIIENLRKQTERRLWNDLNHPGTLSWISLQQLSKKSPMGNRAQDLIFDHNANQRYFTVCLKNKTRLENLISWMNTDKNKLRQMKIIIIDDEADQAGVNTQDITKEERAKINSLIVKLVEGDQIENGNKPKSMNYISYTATPYSNFLNESGIESLYPKDFIGVLKTSNEYFGPKQIFGVQETENNDGLNIVREISENDLQLVKEIHEEETVEIPIALRDSICWFLCAAASLRKFGYKKPVSMLVHTSQKQKHHKDIARIIEYWIDNTERTELLNHCEKVYKDETSKFSLDNFREQFKEYSIPDSKIKNYPEFSELTSEIEELMNNISHIRLGDDGDLVYQKGIHLCIDNCSNNGITDEGMFVRLAYPDPNIENYPSPAPAFIIVGGSTLSRGLTIEGLVSTFFLRASTMADSLMQMGRWFGYRKGYELFPRIWMTTDTYEKFEFLATLEEELRTDLRRFSDAGESPAKFGPRVKNSPKASWLKITSKNKMQGAELIDMDFTGTSNQTYIFSDDSELLKENITITENFLSKIGKPKISYNNTSLVWHGVDFNIIKNELLLDKFNFHQRTRVFNQIDAFCQWYEDSLEETGFTDWNVVVSGKGDVNTNIEGWSLKGGTVGKVNRSRKGKMIPHDKSVSIGVLRAPIDLLADVNKEKYEDIFSEFDSKSLSGKNIDTIRKKSGLELTPQLLIYRIDKDSKKSETAKADSLREDLNFSEDIIGISLYIPGKQIGRNYAKALTVKIHNENIDIDSEGEPGEL
jgi:Z1 domain